MRRNIANALVFTAGALIRWWLNFTETSKALAARKNPSHRSLQTIAPLVPGNFAIFAVYPKVPLEEGAIRMLSALADSGVQIIAVATVPLPLSLRSRLQKICSAIAETNNIGRDFGAYQYGVRYIRDNIGFDSVHRLIFMNDSIYYFENRDPSIFVRELLSSSNDYVAANENFEKQYHVGSYLFSVSASVVKTPAFQNFWTTYIPYSTRVHAIDKGEVVVCRTIMEAGFAPKILYSLSQIMPFVEQRLNTPELDDPLWCMEIRRVILANYARLKMRGLPEPINVVKDDIRTLLQERNQVHLMGLLFVKHLGMPFMKKDIISRGIHLLRDVPILVEEEDLDTPEAILVPFRYRGSPASRSGGMTRVKSLLGLI